MSSNIQSLISEISLQNINLLTAMLSPNDFDSWAQNKHVIISHAPFLTLAMSVNRVEERLADEIPEPGTIRNAIIYAYIKQFKLTNDAANDRVAPEIRTTCTVHQI